MRYLVNITICLAVILLILITCNCTFNGSEKKIQGSLTELTDDGSWGYAGRFAYIARNMLFFSYLDREGSTWVASYDLKTGEIQRNNIWQGQSDLHSANPLMIRPDGRIQVFLDRDGYSENTIAWKVSNLPYSVTEFGELKESSLEGDIVQGRQFYPMVNRVSGEVYLVINALRDNVLRETVMWKSPDGGDTWTVYNNLWGLGRGLSGNRCYTRTYMRGEDIHFVTLRVGWDESLAGNKIGMVEGIYYIRYNVKEEAFFRSDGTRSFILDDVPVYKTEYFDEIWNWKTDGHESKRALWSDIVADKNGKPYVAFNVQESVPPGNSALHDGYWSTPDEHGKWQFHHVATLARGWDNKPERKNYAIAIDPYNPKMVYVAENISSDNNLSEVVCLGTEDGGKNWDRYDVISDKGRNTTIVLPEVLDDTEPPIVVLWLDGKMDGWREYDTGIMMYNNNN